MGRTGVEFGLFSDEGIAGVADDLTGLPVQEIEDDQSAKHPVFVHPDGSHFMSKLSKT